MCKRIGSTVYRLSKLLVAVVGVGYRLASNSALGHVAVSVLNARCNRSACLLCSYSFGIKNSAPVSKCREYVLHSRTNMCIKGNTIVHRYHLMVFKWSIFNNLNLTIF